MEVWYRKERGPNKGEDEKAAERRKKEGDVVATSGRSIYRERWSQRERDILTLYIKGQDVMAVLACSGDDQEAMDRSDEYRGVRRCIHRDV